MSNSSFYRRPEPTVPMREFNVGEDVPEEINVAPRQSSHSYELNPAERAELQRLRQQQAAKDQRLGEHARKRIELLADIGRLTKDVTIDNIQFSLRTLKTKEARDATMSVFKCANDVEAAYELRRQTLARAIYQIDGQPVELALGGDEFELKLELIDEMEEAIVNKLNTTFNELRQEVRVKYGLETEEQVKGVVEDLKK